MDYLFGSKNKDEHTNDKVKKDDNLSAPYTGRMINVINKSKDHTFDIVEKETSTKLEPGKEWVYQLDNAVLTGSFMKVKLINITEPQTRIKHVKFTLISGVEYDTLHLELIHSIAEAKIFNKSSRDINILVRKNDNRYKTKRVPANSFCISDITGIYTDNGVCIQLFSNDIYNVSNIDSMKFSVTRDSVRTCIFTIEDL